MTLEEKIINTQELNKELDALTKQKEELEQKIKDAETMKANYLVEILGEMKELGTKEEQVDNIFATLFSRTEVAWLDDVGLLKKLQENNANEFIKVTTKVSTSIDKNALKKAFKTNESLKEQYKEFYGDKLIEYVVVNDAETHARMLEHIETGK